jgi:cysteine desulfuration protein SufE
MSTMREIEQEIIDEFAIYEDWMEKYEYIIELGKDLPLIEESLKTEDRLIKGCQSRVWVNAAYQDGKMIFTADSDAIITKGIIGLLIRVLSNQNPADIVKAELNFIKEIGLQEHLSPTRANGLVSMIQQMKLAALAHAG